MGNEKQTIKNMEKDIKNKYFYICCPNCRYREMVHVKIKSKYICLVCGEVNKKVQE